MYLLKSQLHKVMHIYFFSLFGVKFLGFPHTGPQSGCIKKMTRSNCFYPFSMKCVLCTGHEVQSQSLVHIFQVSLGLQKLQT